MARFFASALVIVAIATASAPANGISYSESFNTAGQQAVNTGDTFADYPGWTYTETTSGTSYATVDASQRLDLVANNTGVPYVDVYSVISSQTIAGTSAFDVSTYPLTVSASLGGTGTVGLCHVGMSIGDVYFKFDIANGNLQARTAYWKTYQVYQSLPSFTSAQGSLYNMSVTISNNPSDTSKYNISFSLNPGNITASFLLPTTDFGAFNSVGFGVEAGTNTSGTGYYDNLAVTQQGQVPEPSTLMLLAAGLIGLLCYAWRRRR